MIEHGSKVLEQGQRAEIKLFSKLEEFLHPKAVDSCSPAQVRLDRT